MGDMGDQFRQLKEIRRVSRRRRLNHAEAGMSMPWIKLSAFHWRLKIGDKLLDYWPTTGKVRWLNRTMHSTCIDEVERFAQGLLKDVK